MAGPDASPSADARELFAGELRDAVAEGGIVAWFQPQVDAGTEAVVAVEALARWQHPRLGLLGPEHFIALAESTAVIHDIGAVMIDKACRAVASLRDLGFVLQASVNVSAVQLRGDPLTDRLIESVIGCDLAPGDLTMELTESRPILDLDAAIARLRVIAQHGIGISLDDFGRGHAVATLADRLPLTELKLDMSLVLADHSGPRELPALIASLRRRRVRTVVEGVSSTEHVEHARRLGVDRLQGFLFGRPMPLDDLIARLGVGGAT